MRIRQPKKNVHPVVRELFALIDGRGVAVASVAGKAGWDQSTVAMWRQPERHPSLRAISDCLEVLGYELVVEKIQEAKDQA